MEPQARRERGGGRIEIRRSVQHQAEIHVGFGKIGLQPGDSLVLAGGGREVAGILRGARAGEVLPHSGIRLRRRQYAPRQGRGEADYPGLAHKGHTRSELQLRADLDVTRRKITAGNYSE